MDCLPSILIVPGGPCVSFAKSMAGVAASVPLPAMGHIRPDAGLSVAGMPDARFVVQDVLP